MKVVPFYLAVFIVVAMPLQSAMAKKSLKFDTTASQRAISALLAASDEFIPAASTCHGSFGGEGPARVRDLVAMELATFSRGQNTLTGACQAEGAGQACHVAIEHQFGEEASSATIRFRVTDGRADVETLSCVLTP